jgi:hypothetical protein
MPIFRARVKALAKIQNPVLQRLWQSGFPEHLADGIDPVVVWKAFENGRYLMLVHVGDYGEQSSKHVLQQPVREADDADRKDIIPRPRKV